MMDLTWELGMPYALGIRGFGAFCSSGRIMTMTLYQLELEILRDGY